MPNEETRENAHATEGPYPVPGNWRWGKINELYEINPKNDVRGDIPAAFVPMEKISAGMSGAFTYDVQPWEKAKKGHTQFADGDVAFAKISPCFENRKSMLIQGLPNGIGGGTTELVVLRQPKMEQKYTFLLVSSDRFIQGGRNTYSGTVGQQRISMDFVRQFPVPVPPRAEQRRIVERVERLFAKLDAAKEKAQSVIDGCEKRKAAILHKAFSGDLTAEWRSERDISENSWKQVPLSSVCSSIFDGDHLPPPKSETGIPFLVIGNVSTGYLSFENTRFVPREYYDSLSAARKPQFGDILYTLVGSYGIPIIVDSERPFCFQRHMALLKPSCINTRFLWYQLQSREFYNQASEIATGTAQLTVPIKGLRNLLVNLPCEEEQRKSVSLLDSLLFGNKRIQSDSEHVLRHLASLKNSILARAFRGELGTNDPSELPAAL